MCGEIYAFWREFHLIILFFVVITDLAWFDFTDEVIVRYDASGIQSEC